MFIKGYKILFPAFSIIYLKEFTIHCLKTISSDRICDHLPSLTLTLMLTIGYPKAGPHVRKSDIVLCIAYFIYFGRESRDRRI